MEVILQKLPLPGAVAKKDLRRGDRVLIRTANSAYTIFVLDEGVYWVWGGWFDRRGIAPQRVTINGCTWGGSVIKHDIVAARGLHLEFGNRVVTTPIEHASVVRMSSLPGKNTAKLPTENS